MHVVWLWGHVVISSHPVSILDGEVTCTCGLRVSAKSPDEARRISHAHVANPTAVTPVLLAFVRMSAPVVVPEDDPDTLVVW